MKKLTKVSFLLGMATPRGEADDVSEMISSMDGS